MIHPRETGNLSVFERMYLPHRYNIPKSLYIQQNNKKYFLVFDDKEKKEILKTILINLESEYFKVSVNKYYLLIFVID